MFSKLKRIGSKAQKVQLTIELKELIVVDEREDITLVCIELKRGNKSLSSSSKLWSESGTPGIRFDEQLVLLMTLYKDSNGVYIEKKGRLLLNGHSKVTNSSVLLGSADLKLNILASDFETQKVEIHFLDNNGQKFGSLSTNATSKFVSDGCADENESSLVSGISGVSVKSSSQLKDVRYGAVYQDNAGKIDPEVSEETTEKLRSNIMKITSVRYPQDQDDGGTSNDGYDMSGKSSPSWRKTRTGSSPKYFDLTTRRNSECLSPRTRQAFSYGGKDEEIADLHRELEKSNQRTFMAQQDQRNIAAIVSADAVKYEKMADEFKMKISALEEQIEVLNSHTKSPSSLLQSELDNHPYEAEVKEEIEVAESKESKVEGAVQLRKLVESLTQQLEASRVSEAASAAEVIRLQTFIVSATRKMEADKAESVSNAQIMEDATAKLIDGMTAELISVHESKAELTALLGNAESELTALRGERVDVKDDAELDQNRYTRVEMLEDQLSTIKAENVEISMNATMMEEVTAKLIDGITIELRKAHDEREEVKDKLLKRDEELVLLLAEKSDMMAGLTGILAQNKKLKTKCSELKLAISEKEKDSEAAKVEDLQIKLSIHKLSEETLLLDEMSQLGREVKRMEEDNAFAAAATAALRECLEVAEKEAVDFAKAKYVAELELKSSQESVAALSADVTRLETLVMDLYQEMSHSRSSAVDMLQVRLDEAKVQWELDKQAELAIKEHEPPSTDAAALLKEKELLEVQLRASDSRASTAVAELQQSMAEFDIERQIIQTEVEILRVKEKRIDFQQSKQSKRENGDKTDSNRKREIAALLAQNTKLEDDLLKSECLLYASEAKAAEVWATNTEKEKLNIFKEHNYSLSRSRRQGVGSRYVSDKSIVDDAFFISNDDRASLSADSTCEGSSSSAVDKNFFLVERIFALENDAELERKKFEDRIRILLKTLGMYDSTYTNFLSGNDHSDNHWKEVVRTQSDVERRKIMTLKTCLMRFASKLTPDEVDELEDYGIILAPRSSPRNGGLNLGSALCFV